MNLNKAKQVIHKTIIEKEEKNYLLEKHMEKERELREQALQLAITVNESTNDTEKLHKKLDTKKYAPLPIPIPIRARVRSHLPYRFFKNYFSYATSIICIGNEFCLFVYRKIEEANVRAARQFYQHFENENNKLNGVIEQLQNHANFLITERDSIGKKIMT